MPKLIVLIDGVVVKEVQLIKDRTALGRRPYNDVVLDNLAVSGEHAIIQMAGDDVFLEDLNSTNGTYVNGKAVKKQLLLNDDAIEIGKFKIRFINEAHGSLAAASGDLVPPEAGSPHQAPPGELGLTSASIKVLSGAATGREVNLVKIVTTIGKPGQAVAAITKRPSGYVIAYVDGSSRPIINQQPIGDEPVPLSSGDVFELAGTQMQFVQHGA
jgi:pSer/pThr/pTyr-binding forkhead associated (FHA) protein